MAKTKARDTADIVTDFSEPTAEASPRGADLEADIQAIRDKRAAQRAAKGGSTKKRTITNYLDAERLKRLGMLTPEEIVDCEDAGLLDPPPEPGPSLPALAGLDVSDKGDE